MSDADALDPDRGKGTYPSGSQADEMARAIDRLTAERDEANARADAAEAKVRELEKAVDPVEALAEELYAVARNGDDPPWHLATENNREKHRRIARHQIERKDEDR